MKIWPLSIIIFVFVPFFNIFRFVLKINKPLNICFLLLMI